MRAEPRQTRDILNLVKTLIANLKYLLTHDLEAEQSVRRNGNKLLDTRFRELEAQLAREDLARRTVEAKVKVAAEDLARRTVAELADSNIKKGKK